MEDLLEIVGFEVMAEDVKANTYLERERVPDCRSCSAETGAPNEVLTNGTESRLVFDNLREGVEGFVESYGEKIFYVCVYVSPGVAGDQCLTVRVMSVRGRKLPTYVDHLPLSAKSTLVSLGYLSAF